MRIVGLSTGGLAGSDFDRGLRMAQDSGSVAVELSALREFELEPLVAALRDLDLGRFSYVSFHAPSAIDLGNEQRIVDLLRSVADRGWNVIVHPDVMTAPARWAVLGQHLCIENMDKRKPTGRNCRELSEWFERLPQAGFCLDLGHARQCDPTMTEAYFLLKQFGSRLRQLHVSEVTTRSNHERLSRACILSFQEVAKHVPVSVPVILESPLVTYEQIVEEIARVRTALPLSTSMEEPSEIAASLRLAANS